MSRTGVTTAWAVVFSVALAIGTVSPSQATRAPGGDAARIVATGTPHQSLLRAQPLKPSVTKMTPQSGPTTGGLDVVIKGHNLTGVKRVLFGATKADNVRVKSARKLVVQAPAQEAGLVRVRVVTKHGGSKQNDATHFTYVTPQPSLTRLLPRTGPTAGGTTLTITGRDLSGATSVRFGSTSATSFHVTSATTIAAISPVRPTGPVNVTVTTAGGSATLDDAYAFVAAPTLSSLSPSSGPANGATVTLTGVGFTSDAVVTFGGSPATGLQVFAGGTQLTLNTPDHAPGWVDVVVATAGGTDTRARGYQFVGGVTLDGVSPSVGPAAGGVNVTLTGSGFTADTLVVFGTKPSLDVTVNPAGTQLTALLPAQAPGTVDVLVSTEGDSETLVGGFTYVVAPTLAAVSPDAGPIAGGTAVTLTGAGFRAGMQVSFGGVAGTGVTVTSATQATVTAPAHVAGAVDVTVTTPGGSATMVNGFAFLAAPTLSSVSPVAGPTAGGTTVTLAGTGFRTGMQVSFGGVPATGVSVSPGGTQLTAATPAHAAGAVTVSVATPGGSDTLSGAYTYVVLPALTDVTPDAGPVSGGTTVTLTGSGFRAGMQVLFGSTPATGVSVNPDGTELTATTPPHPAGGVDVSVSTPGGSATLADGYTYVAPPTLTAVSPDAGPVAGGTTVTLTGTGFRAGMQVFFGSAAATGVSVNPGGTQLAALAPAHAAGGVDVSVTTPGGAATLGNSYTYLVAPTLTSVSPAAGPSSGGTTVTLTGSGFRAGMQVSVGGTPAAVVSINPAGTSLTATTPAHAAGLVDVSVTTVGGSDPLASSFTYVAAPTLVSVNPTDGPAGGGTTVTLTGTGLTGTTDVTFDGVPATGVLVLNDSTVTAMTPAHGAGVVDVSVTTPGGSDTRGNTFTYVALPTLTAVTPDNGPAAGATTVTLTGTGLTGTTVVTFDGVPATGLVVVSDTEVTVDTPAHAVGLVDVELTTPGGIATLPGGYTYQP